ncbi:LuxR C-terminal-related transcriptional regulator [Variovorax sp. V15]|uniref:LuxR C-terminal-related transcriptional regulator n=1 Tax=Variovorax sp. V15 TaxID=3065952 RepID=UPI0034E8521D
MTQNSIISVLVRHADPLVMAGLVALLDREPDFDVQAASDIYRGCADVIVTDYGSAMGLLAASPEAGNGADASLRNLPRPRVVVMTRQDKEGEIAQAMHSGVRGYLLQSADPLELVDAIRHVARGGSHYLCNRAAALFDSCPPRTWLTAREEDVLRFLVKGDCNKGIARKLDISANTVKAHVARICEKLHVRSRAQVAIQATQRGLVRA